MIDYPNLPPSCGAVFSAGKTSLFELQNDLSASDVHLILEIVAVDGHNKRIAEDYYRAHPQR